MHGMLGTILAAAGGGSSGFGGGGGGGGGGFGGGGGGGFGGSGGSGGFSPVMFLVIVVIVLLVFAYSGLKTMQYRARRAARERATVRAAAEAATDDADFDPDTVRTEASRLFLAIQRRWSSNDIEGLEQLVGPDLMVEWRRRLEDFRRKGWRNHCKPHGAPKVEYMGLVNREGEDEDRVVVRITASMEDYVVDQRGDVVNRTGERSTRTTLVEWWTLHPPGDRWRLMSIESDAEGRHNLDSPLIATPSADARVADEAVVELATADAVTSVSDIAPAELEEDARAAALDLALADGRFAPDVLEVAARHAVEAWSEAIDGADDALEALAEPAAVAALLQTQGNRRLVVRGARVEQLRISGLDPHAEPATMTASVVIKGIRYVEDRNSAAVLSGSKTAPATTAQRWTFALTGDERTPWRLVGVA
ncbi:MAG TPA: TIM44-like domain-containing protein [Baekduia sp.]|uniref:TIM44-like domain-containing protein n=1 Tax=Baekduia sp. TaxID=2600305 RepID=UPI002D799F14|nr:TIM44-like domain-containing protein [Baekduia sp.]HET6509643.1 TIM44-like domain-containing protein [Baekduia sp.]